MIVSLAEAMHVTPEYLYSDINLRQLYAIIRARGNLAQARKGGG